MPARQAAGRAGAPAAFQRLRGLSRRGYVADLEQEGPEGAMLLHHPRGPDLILYGDGTVELLDRGAPMRLVPEMIHADDDEDERAFERFVARLPLTARTGWRIREKLIFAFWLAVVSILSVAVTTGFAENL